MRRHGYGISVFGAIVLCCLFFCFPAQSDDNAVSIRVGYYEDGDYMSRGRSAEYIGFNIEFLQKLAKVGGMRYEMLGLGQLGERMASALEGHIDMLPAVVPHGRTGKRGSVLQPAHGYALCYPQCQS